MVLRLIEGDVDFDLRICLLPCIGEPRVVPFPALEGGHAMTSSRTRRYWTRMTHKLDWFPLRRRRVASNIIAGRLEAIAQVGGHRF